MVVSSTRNQHLSLENLSSSFAYQARHYGIAQMLAEARAPDLPSGQALRSRGRPGRPGRPGMGGHGMMFSEDRAGLTSYFT